jgi:energy-coupling factor transporter ATP-binding protein EcfA2
MTMPRLVDVSVRGLLGQFDHHIKFPEDWDFAILYGPNGVGKTKILELIEAVVKQQFVRLARIPFESARLEFDDGVALSVKIQNEAAPGGAGFKRQRKWPHFSLKFPRRKAISWNATAESSRSLQARLRQIRDMGAPIMRVAPGIWRDIRSSGLMTDEDVIRTFDEFNFVPVGYELHERQGTYEPKRPTAEVVEFLNKIQVYLIETQRLLNLSDRTATAPERSRDDNKPTVVEFANDLARRLREAMTENSRVSQRLDRAFPRRVLEEARKREPVTEERIRLRFVEQSALREELAEIAVLDAAPEVELPTRKLDRWERFFLWRYLEDTEEKLATFRQILDRTRLFRDIVNSRFLYKKISIDRDHGFRFTTDSGREVLPTELSSGEQHELVLTYNLLFKVESGSLVLIDEPEISLHVAWQQDYINDIRQISKVVDLRFIVATHSPQIIHHWWEHAIELAPFPPESVEK